MMTKPTVAELLEKIDNRYLLVAATAKRAREIESGDEPLVKTNDVSPVSIAADEIEDDEVKITSIEEDDEELHVDDEDVEEMNKELKVEENEEEDKKEE